MSKKVSLVVAISVMMLFLAACGEEKYEPVAINEDTDICVVCKMAIEDGPYATQIITKDGQSLKFDDVGDMYKWKEENGTDTIGAAYVRDYNSLEWIPDDKAFYVYDASFRTPMAFGVVTFEKEADAQAFIDEQGTGNLMTADEIVNHTWEMNREMMDHGDHDHGDEMNHEEDMQHDDMSDHGGHTE